MGSDSKEEPTEMGRKQLCSGGKNLESIRAFRGRSAPEPTEGDTLSRRRRKKKKVIKRGRVLGG